MISVLICRSVVSVALAYLEGAQFRNAAERAGMRSFKAGAALAQITGEVSGILDKNNQIAEAAQEQTALTRTIAESVARLRDVADGVAQDAAALTSGGRDLAQMAVQMEFLVFNFKVQSHHDKDAVPDTAAGSVTLF